MKKGNLLLALMILTLLFFAGMTVRYNYELALNQRPRMARIDPEVLSRQLQSGNLSSRKADFFQKVGPEGGQLTGNSGKILIKEKVESRADFK